MPLQVPLPSSLRWNTHSVARGERQHQDENGAVVRAQRRRGLKLAAGVVGGIALAALTGFASGLGSRVVDKLDSGPPLVTASDTEAEAACGPYVFLPSSSLRSELSVRPPITDWRTVQELPGAAYADTSIVEVSILGGSDRPVTLTGIRFFVTRRERPGGALIINQCGGPRPARALQVDLDAEPPQIVASNVNPDAWVGEGGIHRSRPIVFPWTVSLKDPLLLLLIGTVRSECLCIWRAEIPWVSGSERGTISVDNQGRGYRVVSSNGLSQYLPVFHRWQQFPPQS